LAAAGRDGPAQCALKVEIAISLAKGDGRRNEAVPGGEAAGRNAAPEERRDDVVAVLLVTGEQTIFQQERDNCRRRPVPRRELDRGARQG
jgi:hypothetical protein